MSTTTNKVETPSKKTASNTKKTSPAKSQSTGKSSTTKFSVNKSTSAKKTTTKVGSTVKKETTKSGKLEYVDAPNIKDNPYIDDIKDVKFDEKELGAKPTMFPCPNDLVVTVKKDAGEVIIDEKCCTTLSVLLKNSGEFVTNFSGSHSPELFRVMKKAIKKYLRELEKKLKADYKVAREELKLRRESLPDDMKFNKDDNKYDDKTLSENIVELNQNKKN